MLRFPNWQHRPRSWGWAIKLSRYTVVYDACVLYPAPLRDFLLELAMTQLFRAKWTDEIHDEWIRNVLKNRPDLTPEQLARTRALMDAAVMDCLVDGYQALVPALALPDEDDRHVLAAGCCQSDGKLSPIDAARARARIRQAATFCHSAIAAERRSLYVWRSTRWRSELK